MMIPRRKKHWPEDRNKLVVGQLGVVSCAVNIHSDVCGRLHVSSCWDLAQAHRDSRLESKKNTKK